jgi:hypothetical protein
MPRECTGEYITSLNKGMNMASWDHLPFEVIKNFAYKTILLNDAQLQHCLNCEECSKVWSVFKREAEAIQRAKAIAEKTEEEIRRLLQEDQRSKKHSA